MSVAHGKLRLIGSSNGTRRVEAIGNTERGAHQKKAEDCFRAWCGKTGCGRQIGYEPFHEVNGILYHEGCTHDV